MKMKPFNEILYAAGRVLAPVALCAVMVSYASAQRAPRVVGGTNAPRDAYPWMTALMVKGQSGANAQLCGAALIDPNWVLTACHCVESESANSLDVLVGGYNLNSDDGQRVSVQRIIRHPNYGEASDGSLRNDIALLQLATPVTSVTPIALVNSADLIAPGTVAKGMGWGLTTEGGSPSSILQHVDLNLLGLAETQQTYSGVDASGLGAGWPAGGRDTCQGDSGGPLVVPDGQGGLKIAGVVSFGDGCARPGTPGVYANVLNLSTWIRANSIGGVNPNPDPDPDPNPNPDPDPDPNPGSDDHGDSLAEATTLSGSGTTSGSLETGGDVDIFEINLAADGPVNIATEGSTDTYGYLVDQNDALITQDDDSGDGFNFSIAELLPAGTYYVIVEGYDQQVSGSYTLVANFENNGGGEPQTSPEINVDADSARVDFGAVAVASAPVQKVITISNEGDGDLTIDDVSIEGSDADQFSITTAAADNVEPGRSTTVTVSYNPDAAGSHSATLVIASNDEAEPELAIALIGAATASSGDDHADDIAGATAIEIGARTDGALGLDDADVFELTVTQRGRVTLRTTGDTDTYGILMDADGEVIAEDDDRGRDFNFRIKRRLDPGTYYIQVEGFDEYVEGDYTLRATIR